MRRDKKSRVRRHSRRNDARSPDETDGGETDRKQDSVSSSENGASERPKSASTPLRSRSRTISGSSVKSGRRQSSKRRTSDDDTENVDDRDSAATYTKYESVASEKIKILEAVRKVEDFLTSAKGKEFAESGASPDYDETPRKETRRKSKRKRREKVGATADSNGTEDDAYDEDGRSSERDLARTKKSRSNLPRRKRRKRHGSRGDGSAKTENEEKELPITEILRKAQENSKARYEEPVPLAELTTDRIYVQGRNGFSVFKIPKDRCHGNFGQRLPREKGPPLYPIKVAIVAQKIWNSTGFVHQGLLAGMALMHFILMQTFFRPTLDFFENYCLVSEYYTSIFSYLVTVCVISVFDRFDLAHLNVEHFREIYHEHSKSFPAVPLYLATFCLHQVGLSVDDNVSLLGYQRNTTAMENNATVVIGEEDLTVWRSVNVAKDSLAVLAWLFVALGPPEDMLLSHLKSMEKYVEMPENST